MELKERVYSVLIVSASEKLNNVLSSIFSESRFEPVCTVTSVSAAKRAWNERPYDFVIINSPLPDDAGLRFAIDRSADNRTAVLLLISAGVYAEITERMIGHGVFTLQKPVSRTILLQAFDWMASVHERLVRAEQKTLSVEEKMAEIRLVNRAKWVLISELKMEEPQAHRYIEKQAMDRCVPRRTIAEEIIKLYT